MPQFDNYEVWILVDGEKLPEYGVQHLTRAGRTEITCWIPSEVGKAFTISYKDSIRAFATSLLASLDGNRCPGHILNSREASPLTSDTLIQKGVNFSSDSYRPFFFSNCQLTDDDEFVSSSPNPGEIHIDIEKVTVGGQMKDLDHRKPFPEPKVHERSKKGLVHGIQLGPECIQKRKIRAVTDVQHLVTFKFNYRPLEKLQADGIVPRSSPSSAEDDSKKTEDDSKDIEEARIQALREELRVLEAQQHQKKRKRSNSKTSSRKIKQERSIALDNDVIDLT